MHGIAIEIRVEKLDKKTLHAFDRIGRDYWGVGHFNNHKRYICQECHHKFRSQIMLNIICPASGISDICLYESKEMCNIWPLSHINLLIALFYI